MPYTGIDISGWQAGIPQSVINQADVLIVKATEGTGFVSDQLTTQFVQGVSGNKKVGVYHFARPGSARAQAEYFVNSVKNRELYPDFWVLDFEDNSMLANQSWPLDFMNRVKELTNQPVWFYCYMAPMKLYSYSAIRNKGYKHWIAGYPYGQQSGFGPKMTLDEYITWSGLNSNGIDFAGWQYTSQGRLNGWAGDLDFNWFFDDAFTGETAVKTGTTKNPMESAISWMDQKLGRVTYSMISRNGPSSYDCSSAVYFALKSAGILPSNFRIGNTETMFDDLPKYGFKKIGLNSSGSYDAQRGDIFIWGDKGSSAGAFGHTGIFVNANDIIHCNAGYNGITINNHDVIHAANGYPNVHIYRYQGTSKTSSVGDWSDMATKEEIKAAVREVLAEDIKKQGGANGKTSIRTEAAWTAANFKTINAKLDNINRMVWIIQDTVRIGIPGWFVDGTLGPKMRKLFGYGSDPEATANGDLPSKRKERIEKAKKHNFAWWV